MQTGAAVVQAAAPGPPAATEVRRRRRRTHTVAPYLFVAPFLISFLVFFAIPSVASLFLSLFRYRGYGPLQWVGLDNYASLFNSPSFWQSIQNTLFYWLVPLVPLLALAFILALAVRSKLVRWGRTYKPLLFIPQVMAPVAAAIVWRVILGDGGVVNAVLGIHVGWLTDPALSRWSVSALLLWRAVGWYFVIFLAALTSISPDVIEAAEIDGANAWQRVRYVILPLMRPIFLFAIVIDSIGSLQLFAEPNLLLGGTGSAPPSAAPVMNQVVNNVAGGEFGLAASAGWILFAAIGLISVMQFRLLREKTK